MTRTHNCLFALSFALLAIAGTAVAQTAEEQASVRIATDGTITYRPMPNGDRIPDYSYAGYRSSEAPIPDVAAKVRVPATTGDATREIQRAIDYVSSLAPDTNGFRGAVFLEEGTFRIDGGLVIRASGVVLRGAGMDKTILVGAGLDRQTLIHIQGKNDRKVSDYLGVSESYVPVGAVELPLFPGHGFQEGQRLIVKRPSTKEWIEAIGTHRIGLYVNYQLTHWESHDFDIDWERTITAVTPTSIVLDVPLTNSLDPQYGGFKIATYNWPGRINNVGIENLRLVSEYTAKNEKDENHRWMAVTVENAEDVWVRRVVTEHFVSSAVAVWETARRVTVEDCKCLAPVGEIGAYRRMAFQTLGQQVLFQRCYAEYSWHGFSAGFTTPGPNAFVQCYDFKPYNFSGAVGGWANGLLFDKTTIEGGNLSVDWRDADGQGGGWSGANSLFWQCRAGKLLMPNPPTAQNWAFGMWAQGYGNGNHELPARFLKPESFFYAQLEARTGKESSETDKVLVYRIDGYSAPTPAQSHMASVRAYVPDVIIADWIDSMVARYPLPVDGGHATIISQVDFKSLESTKGPGPTLSVKNGVMLLGTSEANGRVGRTALWRGSTRLLERSVAGAHLTRYVPGRTGRGLTDDIDTVAAGMVRSGQVALMHFPALWYERRRDDHARTMRADADVWAPFYEQPFARSGQGEAFDRLSKYDLDQWNAWYWLRLKQFADRADANGLIFIQEQYLQHNIIEEGAHWADYPWRTANNINDLGFPERTYYAGDKKVFMAEQFYDITQPKVAQYHRQYIRKSLDNFRGNRNVVHHLGYEYTGPLAFVNFWLDVIAEWERENATDVLVMLPGNRDVQLAVLADPVRSKTVEIIDIRQWNYRDDGSLYAPPGGVSTAERQYARLEDPGIPGFAGTYRTVLEIRAQYPDKAVYYSRGGRNVGWASFMAGGSLSGIPAVKNPAFLAETATMQPEAGDAGQYVLKNPGIGYVVYSEQPSATIDLTADKTNYVARWIDPRTGDVDPAKIRVQGGRVTTLTAPAGGEAAVLWISRK